MRIILDGYDYSYAYIVIDSNILDGHNKSTCLYSHGIFGGYHYVRFYILHLMYVVMANFVLTLYLPISVIMSPRDVHCWLYPLTTLILPYIFYFHLWRTRPLLWWTQFFPDWQHAPWLREVTSVIYPCVSTQWSLHKNSQIYLLAKL